LRHQRLEGHEVGFRLARQADLCKNGHAVAKRFFVEVRMVAADEAGILQSPHTPETGGRGNAGILR